MSKIKTHDYDGEDRRTVGASFGTMKDLLFTFALVAAIAGPATAWGVTQTRIAKVEDIVESRTAKIELVTKHDAVIPIIQSDIKDIKDNQKEIGRKIDQILVVVKK